MKRLLILNPNSDAEVTANIARSLAPWQRLGIALDCMTNTDGPRTISTDADVAAVGRDVCAIAAASDADAILVACFSDPGVDRLRLETGRPVFGIQEAGILAAMGRAEKFGIIALSERSVPRHLARIERLGLTTRMAGEIGLSGFGALEVGQSDAAYTESLAALARLREMGAGAVVLGCAGFGPRREGLASESGLVVIDPVQSGVALALGALIGG